MKVFVIKKYLKEFLLKENFEYKKLKISILSNKSLIMDKCSQNITRTDKR